ncbi:hypothetical protein [Aquitalea pelogenes]|uniref:hypothetical protein n=1 Tax=Aquitalea pelogenes TaxID=1293573 RepID=UPI0035AE326C
MSRTIKLIVIHCAASPNGKVFGAASGTAAAFLDQWHAQRGFHRQLAPFPNQPCPLPGTPPCTAAT